MNTIQERGFTLIELLVVIAIISLLSSIVLASLNDARAKSRNSVRLQEINAYARAAELFQTNGGRYPDGGINWTVAPSYRCLGRGVGGTCFVAIYTGNAALDAQFAPNMSKTVAGTDTGLALGGYAYRCIVTTSGAPCYQYTILYQLEGTNQKCAGGFQVDPAYNTVNTYCQIIQCSTGKTPVSGPGGGLPPYTCQ